MAAPFDIFQADPQGQMRCIKAVKDIDTAIRSIEALGAGRYMIRSQATGNRFYLDVDSCGLATALFGQQSGYERENHIGQTVEAQGTVGSSGGLKCLSNAIRENWQLRGRT
jgi:hypothetical protein